MDSYGKFPFQFSNNKIKNLRKITIYEQQEKVTLASTENPSTFMETQDYELID